MNDSYSTVRIDKESKEKLEEIAESLSGGIGIKVSKAAALKILIEDAYENQGSLRLKMFERMTKDKRK